MSVFTHQGFDHLVATYGYLAVALGVGLESMGLPIPGETILVVAAVYAATHAGLNIWLIVVAASAGAIIGDNLGYWLGSRFGYPLLLRYGRRLGLSEGRIKVGQYLFMRYGGKVVFLGRFVALLRILAAFLAGVKDGLALLPARQCTGRRYVGRCIRVRRVYAWNNCSPLAGSAGTGPTLRCRHRVLRVRVLSSAL